MSAWVTELWVPAAQGHQDPFPPGSRGWGGAHPSGKLGAIIRRQLFREDSDLRHFAMVIFPSYWINGLQNSRYIIFSTLH